MATKHSEEFELGLKVIGAFVVIVLALVVRPVLLLWALNALFPSLQIAWTLRDLFFAFVAIVGISGVPIRNRSK